MELTGGQKTKWIRIKKEILKRPLLITKLPYPNDELHNYLTGGFPDKNIITNIDKIIIKERVKLCKVLGKALKPVVAYRETPFYSKLIGVSESVIRSLIDDKLKNPLSFDTILKIEIYLYFINNYNVSIFNKELVRPFIDGLFSSINGKLRKNAEVLYHITAEIEKLKDNLIEKSISKLELVEISYLKQKLKDNLGDYIKTVESFNQLISKFE